MPEVNPDLLTWARESAGLTLFDAAKKVQIGGARGIEPAERLAALESGAIQPTRSQLARMAKSYRRPLIAFYLDEPPRPSEIGTDFRTLNYDAPSKQQDALVKALVRNVIARQGIVRSELEDDDAEKVAFVGTVSMAEGRERVLRALREVLESASDIGTAQGEFEKLRDAAERAGVYVLLQGDLGSHHTALETTAFRGFVLSCKLAPFIVINSNDARAAWSFTLLHEMVHLLLGHTGISGADSESDIERFCNDVASEYLLPSSVVEAFDASDYEFDELMDAIAGVATNWKVSRALVAYRLNRSGKISRSLYSRLAESFRQQWKMTRAEREKGQGGPDYYAVKRHRIGSALLQMVAAGLGEGALSTTKAALVLGVKPTQVGRVLGMQAD